jgi:hypothetical protein
VVSWNAGVERIKAGGALRSSASTSPGSTRPSRRPPGPGPDAGGGDPGRPGRGRGLAAAQGRVTVLGQRGGHRRVRRGRGAARVAKTTRDLDERRRLDEQRRRLALLAERERIAGGRFEQIAQVLFAVGLEFQAATFADDATLRVKVDAAVQHLDEVIVDLRNHLVQLRAQ